LVVVVTVVSGALASAALAAAQAPPPKPSGGPRTSTPLRPPGLAHHREAGIARAQGRRLAAATSISACGQELTAAGTYNVTANLTDSGSGACIWIAANGVTLNLNGHTIQGTGTDTCIGVEDQSASSFASGPSRSVKNDVINGGAGHLNGCDYGLYTYYSTRTSASDLTIAPNSGTETAGVYEYYSVSNVYQNITVKDGSNDVDGFKLEYGSGNHVLGSTVTSTGGPDFFYVYYETNDQIRQDTAKDPSGTGNGDGFEDYYSNRNGYALDKALGQDYGFYFYEDTYGTVTAVYNTSSHPGDTSGYGFYTYYAYDDNNYGSQNHSMISGNKVTGNEYGFYDEYNIAAFYHDNSTSGNADYGYYFYYPADYEITGNTSNGTSGAYGFYFEEAYSYYPIRSLSGNLAENEDYGYYAGTDSYGISGSNNQAKNDTYDSYGVEVS
jgi:hypothetical protein